VTLLQDAPPTAVGPTIGSTARRARGPVLVAAGLVLVGVLVAVLSASGPGGRLDPDSYTPGGSRAVAELLRQRGVEVDRVETLEAVVAADRPDTTVVVPFPQGLAESEVELLAGLASSLVLIGAGQEVLDVLDVPVDAGPEAEVERRRPACELPAAVRAGDADLGGKTYRVAGAQGAGCYSTSGAATLLVVPSEGLTLLGTGRPLTNERLDDRGNASLALGLLGETNRVLWLIPRAGRAVPAGEQPPLSSLVPDALKTGALYLLLVTGVLALWRARRLGRVVEEPLPVVVRAAEAVEGRSRLYRASGARGSAAEALRTATRERVARRVGMPVTADRPAVVQQVAERTGRDPAVVDDLLYGGAPADDPALVRLAADLRTLEQTLTQEVAGP
jgi:hypothetical protein